MNSSDRNGVFCPDRIRLYNWYDYDSHLKKRNYILVTQEFTKVHLYIHCRPGRVYLRLTILNPNHTTYFKCIHQIQVHCIFQNI